MKIICTGNPKDGLAKSLQKIYPDITFISRATGYDLTEQVNLERFKNLLPFYDVFINHSQLVNDLQCSLLRAVKEVWSEGHVINIGSVLEFAAWEWIDIESASEKRKLRDLSLELSTEKFKTTHLILGGFQKDNGDASRIHTDNIANTIKWILEYDCHIPLLYVDKISDELIQHYNSIRP